MGLLESKKISFAAGQDQMKNPPSCTGTISTYNIIGYMNSSINMNT